METVGTRLSPSVTVTAALSCPQAPRKLHRVTVTVCVPGVMALWGTSVGGLTVKLEVRKACRVVASPEEATENTGVAQGLPPDPDEAERSISSGEHRFTSEGMARLTVGGAGLAGARMETFAEAAADQEAQAAVVQAARSLPGSRASWEPTASSSPVLLG